MDKIVKLPNKELQSLIIKTAKMKGFHNAIIEKDLWICYTLDYLFHRSQWKDSLVFKGGTSLSKGYNLIKRFSEDIDLILDWRVLGYQKYEPWENRSNTKQDKFNKEASERISKYLEEVFCPIIKEEISRELGINANVFIDENNKHVVAFAYPRIFENSSILPLIRLEIGALARWTPSKVVTIKPYVADIYPNLFGHGSTDILTVTPERTFWEKISILHHEANRPEHSPLPSRYSRHYYDIYQMTLTNVKELALEQMDLLDKVVKFKLKFYPQRWAKYEDAKPGTLKLIPPEYRLPALKADYIAMKDMLYGDIPSFEAVMETLKHLEDEINKKC